MGKRKQAAEKLRRIDRAYRREGQPIEEIEHALKYVDPETKPPGAGENALREVAGALGSGLTARKALFAIGSFSYWVSWYHGRGKDAHEWARETLLEPHLSPAQLVWFDGLDEPGWEQLRLALATMAPLPRTRAEETQGRLLRGARALEALGREARPPTAAELALLRACLLQALRDVEYLGAAEKASVRKHLANAADSPERDARIAQLWDEGEREAAGRRGWKTRLKESIAEKIAEAEGATKVDTRTIHRSLKRTRRIGIR